MSLQSDQAPIFGRIANALIQATPEHWSSALLELTQVIEGSVARLSHSISNSEYPKDIVQPTAELFEATNELAVVSERHKDHWRRCLFRVFQEGESWRFKAEFER